MVISFYMFLFQKYNYFIITTFFLLVVTVSDRVQQIPLRNYIILIKAKCVKNDEIPAVDKPWYFNCCLGEGILDKCLVPLAIF